MFLCADCFRHVRTLPCPFCGCATSRGGKLPGASAIRVGMRRGVLLLGLAGAATQGCGGDAGTPDVLTVMDVYGIPPDAQGAPDAAGDAAGAADAAPDMVVVTDVAVYGIPPDASADASPDAPVVTDAAVYGIPPDAR